MGVILHRCTLIGIQNYLKLKMLKTQDDSELASSAKTDRTRQLGPKRFSEAGSIWAAGGQLQEGGSVNVGGWELHLAAPTWKGTVANELSAIKAGNKKKALKLDFLKPNRNMIFLNFSFTQSPVQRL
jgi:hypothetical protein